MPENEADTLDRHHRLVRGLARPDAWPRPFAGAAELIETHLSSVLLAGDWALKLKKPLALDFVDFSTRERRHHFCTEELRLNRRTAARWYVDVLPVLGPIEAPRLGRADDADDAAAAVDWALRMRRFDRDAAFDRLAAAGRLGEAQVDALARAVATFHAALPPSPAAWGDPHDVRRVALDNLATLATLGVEPQALAALRDWSVDAHAALAPRLQRRRARGRVREGHGDLHLGNIAWLDGAPVLFDALEFDPRLRHVDTMSDAAFTFMDLLDHARPALGWRFLSAYLELGGDHDALPTVRAFAVHRALVRAKVAAIRAAQPDAGAAVQAAATAAAQRRIALASSLAHPAPPRLVNTDGEPLEVTTLEFAVTLPVDEVFERLLPLATVGGEQFVRDVVRDERGAVTHAEMSWVKAGNRKHASWDNTILGRLMVGAGVVVAEANSSARANRITREIGKRLGRHARLVDRTVHDLQAELRRRRAPGTGSGAPPEDADDPSSARELQELTDELTRRHWAERVDVRVPALGNKTPRQAARTAKGRERLAALFGDFDRRAESQSDATRDALREVKRTLGME